ncbi:hypothetical protein [Streptomyces sp. NPDC046985]|uniref:hypothetical protein n=1 Tax=Streptomyces sp. NPDC046985 TaxID=3155377 RepID=UPI0033D13E91
MRIATAVATLAVALGTAGCGGARAGDSKPAASGSDAPSATSAAPSGAGGASTTQAVQDAYRKTVDANSARMTVTTEALTEGNRIQASGSGVIDLHDGASQMTLTSQGNAIEQRVVDGILYEKPSAGSGRSGLLDGKSWMKIDLGRLARSGGGSRASDPAETLQYVKEVLARNASRVGQETVDGTAVTHYRVSVPVTALAGGHGGSAEELKRQLGVSSLPVDLWLDGDGRLRQERVRLVLHPLRQRTPQKQDTEVTSTTLLKLSDFGAAVNVTPPSAADTVDITDKTLQVIKSGQDPTQGR